MSTKPILSVSTLEPERPYITIDGSPYQLRVPDDFSVAAQARLNGMRREFAGFQGKLDSLSDEEIERAEQILEHLTQMIVLAPPELVAALPDNAKVSILRAFQKAVVPQTKQPRKKRTSAKRSPASAPSTAPTTG